MSTQKNTQDISAKMAALEQRLSALESREEAHFAEVSQSIAVLKAEPPAKAKSGGSKSKKPKPEGAEAEAEAGAEAEAEAKPKKPSAWTAFIGQTVAEMKQSGWESFQSADGVVWPASRREGEHYVYDGGKHDGKAPSHGIGGMVRASYLRAQNNPEAETKRQAYRAGLAEKHSTGSVGSAQPEGESSSKKGRPKMTEEQKAEAKIKRDAKKAAAKAAESKEEEEMAAEEAGFQSVDEGSTTPREPPPPLEEAPKASVGGGAKPPTAAVAKPPLKSRYPPPPPVIAGSTMSKIAAGVASKKGGKPLDLSLFPWTFNGVEYFTNDRKDVLTYELGWVGRFNGTIIDKTAPNPPDMADPEVRENDF